MTPRRFIRLCAASILPAVIAMSASGCDLVPAAPPYVISVPVCVAGPCDGYYRYAGINFDFCNTAEKTIASLSIACLVYDSTTKKNPFAGTNAVSEEYDGAIRAGESVPMKISLDGRVHVAPKEPYFVDFFSVSRIVYTDGSSWEDPTCAYYARSY